MFYATALFPVDTIEDRDKRARVFNEHVEKLFRQRTLMRREEQKRQEGRLLTPAAELTTGDVIVVMVDPGEGQRASEQIARLLAG